MSRNLWQISIFKYSYNRNYWNVHKIYLKSHGTQKWRNQKCLFPEKLDFVIFILTTMYIFMKCFFTSKWELMRLILRRMGKSLGTSLWGFFPNFLVNKFVGHIHLVCFTSISTEASLLLSCKFYLMQWHDTHTLTAQLFCHHTNSFLGTVDLRITFMQIKKTSRKSSLRIGSVN